ncbi:alpha/beta-hydrolase [Lophium mytilinum]|uniref:Alpha/beta-hydrolase n=1 Tax=Lophium mytilinum TaxID=390894 RepID=A0A6A6QMK8_9PEZI|nr:alpha/beta-hydrolase [Lophium mytilinum]
MQYRSLCFVFLAFFQIQVYAVLGPLGHNKNGTFMGLTIPQFKQDFFLGIPYAKPLTGEYRSRYPRSLTSKFPGVKDATKIGYTCSGKDNATLYSLNEDCLNLNIIRPSDYHTTKRFPVLVQLYGGAGQTGSTNSNGNNMTFLVQRSQEMNQRQNVISGDVVFNSNSRQDARVMSAAGMAVYKYQFATPSWTSKEVAPEAYLGAGHVTNQRFSFNLPNNFTLPWCGSGEARARLKEMASSMTVAFVATLDPNEHGRKDFTYWPAYNESRNGINFVFKDSGSWVEEVTFREEAIDWLIETQAGRGQ